MFFHYIDNKEKYQWHDKKRKKYKKQKIKDPSKKKSNKDDMPIDSGIVIVDDDLIIDKESVHEERRAYLEEARSQEASSD